MRSYQERANMLIKQGNDARARGNRTFAIEAFQEAIDLVPGYGSLYLHIANMYFEENNIDRAAAAYIQALEYEDNQEVAWIGLGQCQLLSKDYPAAVDSFEQALGLNTRSPEANYYLAMLRAMENQSKIASDFLFTALTIHPGWEDRARQEPLLAALFETSPRLASFGRGKRWWEFWK